jgi:hypothetical protein
MAVGLIRRPDRVITASAWISGVVLALFLAGLALMRPDRPPWRLDLERLGDGGRLMFGLRQR